MLLFFRERPLLKDHPFLEDRHVHPLLILEDPHLDRPVLKDRPLEDPHLLKDHLLDRPILLEDCLLLKDHPFLKERPVLKDHSLWTNLLHGFRRLMNSDLSVHVFPAALVFCHLPMIHRFLEVHSLLKVCPLPTTPTTLLHGFRH